MICVNIVHAVNKGRNKNNLIANCSIISRCEGNNILGNKYYNNNNNNPFLYSAFHTRRAPKALHVLEKVMVPDDATGEQNNIQE